MKGMKQIVYNSFLGVDMHELKQQVENTKPDPKLDREFEEWYAKTDLTDLKMKERLKKEHRIYPEWFTVKYNIPYFKTQPVK